MNLAAILHAKVCAAGSMFDRCEADLRRRCDARSVHALRVAARRMRALLWSMKPWVRRDPYRVCVKHLKAIARQLAPLRDLDVLRDVLLTQVAGKTGLAGSERRQLDIDIRRQREKLRRNLPAAMRSARHGQHSRQVRELLAGRGLFRKSVPASAAPWRQRILCGVDSVDRRSHRAVREDLHRIRILVKRCRYSLEALGPDAPQYAHQRMTDLQTLLGHYCDVRFAASWLEEPDSLRDRSLRKKLLRKARGLARQRAKYALRVLHDYCSGPKHET